MSGLDWAFTFTLGILYFALMFTVCVVTFRKGHWVLGVVGFFIPILWLIGAVLPSKTPRHVDSDPGGRGIVCRGRLVRSAIPGRVSPFPCQPVSRLSPLPGDARAARWADAPVVGWVMHLQPGDRRANQTDEPISEKRRSFMAIGPVQLIVLGFSQPNFHGEIIAELERLRESDMVRVIDSLAVYKDAEGELEVEHLSNLSEDQAIELGTKIGALIGLGIEGEEGMEAGAVAGAEQVEADGGVHVFTEEEGWDILEDLPNGSAAALILLEHHWAVPLRDAIARAGGFRLSDGFISPLDLVEVGLVSAEEAKELRAGDVGRRRPRLVPATHPATHDNPGGRNARFPQSSPAHGPAHRPARVPQALGALAGRRLIAAVVPRDQPRFGVERGRPG